MNKIRKKSLPFGRAEFSIYLFVALIGTLLPNTASYLAVAQLPAGINIEKFSWQSDLVRESINGFGHPLYPDRDPRADALLSMMSETYPDHAVLEMAQNVQGCL